MIEGGAESEPGSARLPFLLSVSLLFKLGDIRLEP